MRRACGLDADAVAAALLQLDVAAHAGEGEHERAERRLMADEDGALERQLADQRAKASLVAVRRERVGELDRQVVRLRDPLRRLPRARQRTGDDPLRLREELGQPARDLLHPLVTGLGQLALFVPLGPFVFGDAVPQQDDEHHAASMRTLVSNSEAKYLAR